MPNELELNFHKIGQGQPKVMFYTNFVVLQSIIKNGATYQVTKLLGNWPSGSWEKDFFKVLSFFEHGSQPSLMTKTIWLSLLFCIPCWLHIKYTII